MVVLSYLTNFHLIFDCIVGSISMIPLLLVFQVIPYFKLKYKGGQGFKISLAHLFLISIFSFLLASIFVVTGGPSILYIRKDLNLNLDLFIGLKTNLVQYLLNILLFTPFGLLLPMLWKKFNNIFLVIATGFFCSLIIELGQIFTFRATDVDDLFTNTLGTLIGYLIFLIIKMLFPKLAVSFLNKKSEQEYRKCFNCILLSWLGMFFVEPFVSELLNNLIY